jgi:hypothetical protein
MEKETKRLLELIVEKGNKLHEFAFEKHVEEKGLNIKGTRQADDSWLLEFGIPDVKDRDAFLLTFRLFYQENEPISFHKLHIILLDKSLSDGYRNKVAEVQKAFFTYIQDYSPLTVEIFDGRPTRKLMIDVGLYGGLAHTNNPNRVIHFNSWTSEPIHAQLFEQEFTRFLVHILGFIYYLADLTLTELNP